MTEHGTLSHYVNAKCRCESCRLANAIYSREVRKRERELIRLGRAVRDLTRKAPQQ